MAKANVYSLRNFLNIIGFSIAEINMNVPSIGL